MAHFAQLDDNNTVTQVVVINNADIVDETGDESETKGILVCQQIFGQTTRWVQTSYNHKFRKKYAAIGDIYDEAADVFYWPVAPYPSWTMDSNFDWQPPEPRPEGHYVWHEPTLSWQQIPS